MKDPKELARAYMDAYNEAFNRTVNEEESRNVAMAVTCALAIKAEPEDGAKNMTGRIFTMLMPAPPAKNPARKKPKKSNNKVPELRRKGWK